MPQTNTSDNLLLNSDLYNRYEKCNPNHIAPRIIRVTLKSEPKYPFYFEDNGITGFDLKYDPVFNDNSLTGINRGLEHYMIYDRQNPFFGQDVVESCGQKFILNRIDDCHCSKLFEETFLSGGDTFKERKKEETVLIEVYRLEELRGLKLVLEEAVSITGSLDRPTVVNWILRPEYQRINDKDEEN